MPVYVDALVPCARSSRWPFTRSAHLVADTLDELHAFASRLGLRRAWFQPKSSPHYDLTANKHALALRLGAKPIDRRELVALIQRNRRLSPPVEPHEDSPIQLGFDPEETAS